MAGAWGFVREVSPRVPPARTPAGCARAVGAAGARGGARPAGVPGAAQALASPVAASCRRPRPARQWTSRRPTPCCRCSPPTPGAGAGRDRGSLRPSRFGGWGRVFWCPMRLHAGLEGFFWRRPGSATACVELARRFGAGAARPPAASGCTEEGTVLLPIDRATMAWCGATAAIRRAEPPRLTPPHRPPPQPVAQRRRAPTIASRARAAREHAADFVTRMLARLGRDGAGAARGRAGRSGRSTPSCSGTGGTRDRLAGAVVAECERQGLGWCARRRAQRLEPGALAARGWAGRRAAGAGRRLRPGRDPRWPSWRSRARGRARACSRRARGRRGALRELLALQASDWAVPGLAQLAAPYARERFDGARRCARARHSPGPGRERGGPAQARLRRSSPARLARRRLRRRSLPAHPRGRLAHADHRAGTPPTTALAGNVLRDHGVRADTGCRRRSPPAGCTRRSRSRRCGRRDVALVDPCSADRALDLDHAVVEVDHHHAVGDDALASDRDG